MELVLLTVSLERVSVSNMRNFFVIVGSCEEGGRGLGKGGGMGGGWGVEDNRVESYLPKLPCSKEKAHRGCKSHF